MNGMVVGGSVMEPVPEVRDPAALWEARRRKAEKAFKKAVLVEDASDIGEWQEFGDIWRRSFRTESAADADDAVDAVDAVDVTGPEGEDVVEPKDDGDEEEKDDVAADDREEAQEPEIAFGDEKIFEVEFKHNAAIVIDVKTYNCDEY